MIFLEPTIILGAMLGEVAFEIPIDLGQGIPVGAKVRNVFTKKGKMVRHAKGGRPEAPENTTINTIIVVEHSRPRFPVLIPTAGARRRHPPT